MAGARTVKKRKIKRAALEANPFKKGVCLRVYTTAPKKPNSANRKVCKVQLSNGIKVIAYIPGEFALGSYSASIFQALQPALCMYMRAIAACGG